MEARNIPVPDSWSNTVKRAMLHTVGLAKSTLITAHSWSENHGRYDVNTAGELDRVKTILALRKRQLELFKRRFSKVPAKNRPYFSPPERMEVLILKGANNWNQKQTADEMMLDEGTIASWIKRLDETGEHELIRINEPVNKYPEYLHYVVKQLKALLPLMGKEKMAEYFLRAGLNMSASSVGRFLKSAIPNKPFMPDSEISGEEDIKVVTSRHPDHTWMIDLTVVPTSSGMWTSWIPHALLQYLPFSYWVAVIIDHFSRRIMGIAAFPKQPTAEEVVAVLEKTVRGSGKKPKYIISDKGRQFHPPKNAKHKDNHPYRKWSLKLGIRPRYGAIGKYGSIAIIERFMKTLKNECTRRIVIPLNIARMREELVFFALWYNEYRLHSAFLKKQNRCEAMEARTPQEVYDGFRMLKMPNAPPVKKPTKHNCDIPPVRIEIAYFEGRRHLPIIKIRKLGKQEEAA